MTKDQVKQNVINTIRPNRTKGTTSQKIQDRMIEIIDLIGGDSGIDIQEFSVAGTNMVVTGTRTVIGSDITLVFNCEYKENTDPNYESGYSYLVPSESLEVTDVIPLNYANKKWFKVNDLTTIVNEVATKYQADDTLLNRVWGDFGNIIFNDLSSYVSNNTSQDPNNVTGDVTKIFIAGNKEGSMKTFDTSTPYGFIGNDSSNSSGFDRDEAFAQNNYFTTSPKDLTAEGLNITFQNITKMYEDLGESNTYVQTIGKVSLVIKGTLI